MKSVSRDRLTRRRCGRFLLVLERTGCVAMALRSSRISKDSAYRLRKRDPLFAEAWSRALEAARTAVETAREPVEAGRETEQTTLGLEETALGLEETARRKALEGNVQMLMFLLKARHPERYRDRPRPASDPRAEGNDAREFVRRVLAADEPRRLARALLAAVAHDADAGGAGLGDECGTLVPRPAPAIVE